jgi:hypothetical protein
MARSLRVVARAAGFGLLGWSAWAVVAWLRYGHCRPPSLEGGDPLDAFIPEPEVDEVHETGVRAPAPVALAAAKELDVQRSPLVRLIFHLRTLPTRLREARCDGSRPGSSRRPWRSAGAFSRTSRACTSPARSQPWKGEVEFRALPPEEFAAFDEPGYAKIVWTLEAEELRGRESIDALGRE